MSKKTNDSYGHVLRYTGVFGGVQGLKIAMDVVRNKLAAMLLGPAGMGLNAVMMNVAEQVNNWTNLGIGFSGVQRLSEIFDSGTRQEVERTVLVLRTWAVLCGLVGLALCAGMAHLLGALNFTDDHTLEIVVLSLFVASLPVESAECAILKGTRQLGNMARVEILCALSALVFTVPVYWWLGLRGVVLSLVLCGWAKAGVHLWATTRAYPWRVAPWSRQVLALGAPLIRRGVPYMVTAIAGTYTTALIFRYCLDGSTDQIGLYKAAYGLMVTYAGMVFMAMEADYFPRLAAESRNAKSMNHTICQQIDVCVLLMAPLLIAFAMAMPWIVRVLYSSQFLPIVTMAQCAVFYMFFGAVTKPVAYTSLARGDSVMFFVVECVYNAVFAGLMYYGYHHHGLVGTGVALSLAALFDMVMICLLYGKVYRFRMRRSTLALIVPQGLLLALAVAACLAGVTWVKYTVGLPCLALSACITWRKLLTKSRKTA